MRLYDACMLGHDGVGNVTGIVRIGLTRFVFCSIKNDVEAAQNDEERLFRLDRIKNQAEIGLGHITAKLNVMAYVNAWIAYLGRRKYSPEYRLKQNTVNKSKFSWDAFKFGIVVVTGIVYVNFLVGDRVVETTSLDGVSLALVLLFFVLVVMLYLLKLSAYHDSCRKKEANKNGVRSTVRN